MLFLKLSKFFLYLVPFTAIIVYQGSVFPFIVGKYVFFRVVVGIALIFFLLAWASGKFQVSNFKFQVRNFLVIAVFAFCFIYIISGFLGYNSQASFWSNFERGEGGLQILFLSIYFGLLYLLFKEEKDWRRMFVASVWAGFLVILYGVLSILGVEGFVGASNFCERFAGALGNPAYTGTFLLFSIFYSAYLANEDRNRGRKWIWVVFGAIFIIFLLFTQTRGAFIGLGVAIILGLFYAGFSLPKSRTKIVLIILAICLIGASLLGIKYRKHINLMPTCESGNRILDVSFTTETYNTRLLLWGQSLEAFKQRPIFGWGPENFSYIFEKTYDARHYDASQRENVQTRYSQVWFDRAHSIYFDYLVFAGLLGLISFVAVFAAFFIEFSKFNKKSPVIIQQGKKEIVDYKNLTRKALIFSLPIAYLVQGMVLFDVLPIYINLFMFLAFGVYRLTNNQQLTTNNKNK